MKKRFQRWTTERCQKAADLYASGLNRRAIAKLLASNSTRVSHALKSVGIEPKTFWMPDIKTWNAKRDAEVASLYLAGETQVTIARHFKTNGSRVRESLLRCGIQPRRPSVSGSHNPAWKGGRQIDADGYVIV